MLKYLWPLALMAGLLAAPLPAQYPGQYPPGQYPGGGYPGGGISIPSRSHKKKDQDKDQANQPTIAADGQTVSNNGKTLVVATKDGRTLTMTITPKTKFTRSANDIDVSKIVPRTTVHVEAFEDDEANLSAETVNLLKDAPQETPRAEQPRQSSSGRAPNQQADDEEMTRPTILNDPVSVPNRPILRHGKPPATQTADSHPDDQQASDHRPPAQPVPQTAEPAKSSDGDDFVIDGQTAPVKAKASAAQELILKTQEWATTFTNGLPNFVCSQMTTRYAERSKSEGWQPIDVITAKVVYEDGKESYKEITVGGRRTNKSMLDLGGSTSTGEFASILGGLLADQSRAEFKFYQSTTVANEPAAIYDFKVPLANSNWTINVGGQTLRPAYSGSIWIDRATAQVRRIEMQADNIPKDFPEDTIQSAVDYQEVPLGTYKFLLPVHAENLGCDRGSPICTKNTIDFRDYHKYSGESTVVFK